MKNRLHHLVVGRLPLERETGIAPRYPQSSHAGVLRFAILSDAALRVRPSSEASGTEDFPLGVNVGSESIP